VVFCGALLSTDLGEILPEFQTYLRDRKLAGERHIPYYALWASRFIRFAQTRPDKTGEAQVLEFSQYAQTRWSLADWQTTQMQEALKLYLNHFAGMVTPSADDGSKHATDDLPTVLSRARDLMRLKHYSYRTEQTYLEWMQRFFDYRAHTGKAAGSFGGDDVRDFLTHLAVARNVSSSTQNQAFNALLFLFRGVLAKDPGDLSKAVRAKRGVRLPVVLTVDEVKQFLDCLAGRSLLIAQLIYGAGLRLMECARLRVQDLDFEMSLLYVRSGKGDSDRTTILPEAAKEGLQAHLARVHAVHDEDLAKGHGDVYLPEALERKYPNAAREWRWQYVFPAEGLSVDPRSGKIRRHHVSDTAIQGAVKKALMQASIVKRASVHTLRHSFATHLLMSGVNIREVQELLGHKHVETTMIYTHVLRDMTNAPKSPLDAMIARKD
jgi:integron integrase